MTTILGMPVLLTEAGFMAQVVQLAEIRGWHFVHFRPAQTVKGWRTAVSGSLGKGWPDLVLVRERDRRLIFAELKRDGKPLKPEQEAVLGVLRSIEHYPTPLDEVMRQKPPVAHPSIQVCVWRPGDWPKIEATLR